MERYLEQLIEDMQEAATKEPPLGEFWRGREMADKYDLEDLKCVEQYLHSTPRPLSEILGIDQAQLPPVKKLTDGQIAWLYPKVEQLLKAFHFIPDYPEGLPVLEKYRTLREAWNDEQIYVGAGENHIEFCDYETLGCPYPVEFCECQKAEEQLKLDEEEERRRREKYGDEDWDFNPGGLLPF